MKKVKKCIIILGVIIIGYNMLHSINDILKPRNDGVDILYNESDDIDVMFFGSSHAFANINPVTLWDEYGIAATCVSSGEEPIPYLYYSLKETLKERKPQVAVVEVYMAAVEDEYFDNRMYDFYLTTFTNFNPSIDKINIVRQFCGYKNFSKEEQFEAGLSFPGYHKRYSSLTKDDFETTYDTRGFEFVWEVSDQSSAQHFSTGTVQNTQELSEWGNEYIRKIVELCEKEDVELVFLVTPYCMFEEHAERLKSVKSIADEREIPFVDMNDYIDEVGLDYSEDLVDWGHVNYSGSSKVSHWLGKYLIENYEITDRRQCRGYDSWRNLSTVYNELQNNYFIKKETNIQEYFRKLGSGSYLCGLLIKGENNQSEEQDYSKYFGKEWKSGYGVYLVDTESENVYVENTYIEIGEDAIAIQEQDGACYFRINNNFYYNTVDCDYLIVYDKETRAIVDSVYINWEENQISR